MDDFSAIPMVANSICSIIKFVNNIFNDLQVLLDEYGGFA
jgi:hypothetical protein